jgi:hypothetical protein
MADALITDEEISTFATFWRDRVRILVQARRTSLINLLLKDSSLLLTKGYLLITNLPPKLNNSSPSAALD